LVLVKQSAEEVVAMEGRRGAGVALVGCVSAVWWSKLECAVWPMLVVGR
jgi:hypothetical protein